jgi:hypothetical protein
MGIKGRFFSLKKVGYKTVKVKLRALNRRNKEYKRVDRGEI